MTSNKSWLTCLVLLGTVIAAAAPKPAGEQRFAGTWHAKFQGNTFSTLKLLVKDNQLTGSMTGANINLDKDGNLTSAQGTDDESQISDVKLAGDTLSFTTKNEDTEEVINWKMRLTNEREGELLLVMPEQHPGIPTPRPWKIVRGFSKP
jgi:hypothetical protein